MIIPEFLKNRGIKTILGLDYETYFDQEYTLRKLSTTEYIRSPLFKAQGVGLQTNREKNAKWYPTNKIQKALDKIDWATTALLCHHTHFDGLILNEHHGYTPAFYLCTLSMARPLHGGAIKNDLNTLAQFYGKGNKIPDVLDQTKGVRNIPPALMRQLGNYCRGDVTLMWEVFLEMLPKYPTSELQLIDHTVRAYTEPVIKINKKICKEEHKKIIAHEKQVIGEVGQEASTLRSREKFANLLREQGVEPPTKISPRTGKSTYAFAKTDIAFQKLSTHTEESIRNLVEARGIVSSNHESSRALRLLLHADPAYPVYLNYGKAHTLRWTGGDCSNPQNFGRNSKLRNALEAPKGHRFCIADSAQIEARKTAWLAQETELVEDFRNGIDIYSKFAEEVIYNKPINKKDNLTERFVGKTSVLGLGFNMGVDKFRYTLESGAMGPRVQLDPKLYAKAVYGYRNKYKNIVKLWSDMEKMLVIMYTGNEAKLGPLKFNQEGVTLPNGMILIYPRLRPTQIIEARESGTSLFSYNTPRDIQYRDWVYDNGKKIYGGLFAENVVQSLARLVVAEQILRVADKYRVVLLVHDEGVFSVHWRESTKAMKLILEAFHEPPDWCSDLPVAGEGQISKFYIKG